MLIDRDAAIDAAIEGAEVDGNYSLEREESIEEYVMRVPVVDAVVVVRCKDCKHRPTDNREMDNDMTGLSIEFPDGRCPCQCEDDWYNWFPDDDWYCAYGERRDEDD